MGSIPTKNLPSGQHDRKESEATINSNIARNNRFLARSEKKKNQYHSQEEEVAANQALLNGITDVPEAEGLTAVVSNDGKHNGKKTDTQEIIANVATCIDCMQNIEVSETNDDRIDKEVQVNTFEEFQSFSVLHLITSDAELRTMTGLANNNQLNKIVQCLGKILLADKCELDVKSRVILVMVKLKTALSFSALAVLFKISRITCQRYFHHLVPYLAAVLRSVVVWPEKEEVLKNIPKCFQQYHRVRVVLDCTECIVSKPQCLKCRLMTYSHYKGDHTVKFLIGVSPAGLITFVSQAFGGRASDKYITESSGLLEKLIPYTDQVMTDKGFLIETACLEKGIELVRPPFLKSNKQFQVEDANATHYIAKARVHVERDIQRFKLFNVFKRKLEWEMLTHIDDMASICAGVVNLSASILSDERF